MTTTSASAHARPVATAFRFLLATLCAAVASTALVRVLEWRGLCGFLVPASSSLVADWSHAWVHLDTIAYNGLIGVPGGAAFWLVWRR